MKIARLDDDTTIQILQERGWTVEIYSNYWTAYKEYKHRPPLKIMLEFIPPNERTFKGMICICGGGFDKWSNSSDYICYRFPRNEKQLTLLLSNIYPLILRGTQDIYPAVDVTYLLRHRRYYCDRSHRKTL